MPTPPPAADDPRVDATTADVDDASDRVTGTDAPRSIGQRAIHLLNKLLNRKPPSAKNQRLLLAAAVCLFVAVTVLSFRSLKGDHHLSPWWFVVLALGTTPLTVLCNSAEYKAMGDIGGHRISWRDSITLVVLATAANLLPVPGGVVVRTEALRRKGSSLKIAVMANAAAGLTWIMVGAGAVGVLLVAGREHLGLGAAMVAGAAALGGVVWTMLARADRQAAPSVFLRLTVIESATVLVSSVRLWVAFMVLGYSATPTQAIALTAPVIIAAAVGIFPAGLGLREALAGGLGLAVDVPAARAVAATAADRVAAQAGLALLAAGVWWSKHREARSLGDEVAAIEEKLPEATHGPFSHPTDLP